MKKMYFLLATLFTLNYAFAQDNTPTDKGVVFLKGGSNLAIDFFKIKDDLGQEKNSTEFTLNVGGGYFVSKNFDLKSYCFFVSHLIGLAAILLL